MMFVTLQQASDHLRRDSNDADGADLGLRIEAASAMVANYLKDASPYVLDENGDPVMTSDPQPVPVVRPEVKAATLVLVGYLYRQRDDDEKHEWEAGYLPRPVTAILYPLRTPSLA